MKIPELKEVVRIRGYEMQLCQTYDVSEANGGAPEVLLEFMDRQGAVRIFTESEYEKGLTL